MIALFFTYGFLFDGFKMIKFEYECNINKDFKIDILNNDYKIDEKEYAVYDKKYKTARFNLKADIDFALSDKIIICKNSSLSDLVEKYGKSGY